MAEISENDPDMGELSAWFAHHANTAGAKNPGRAAEAEPEMEAGG